MKTLQVIDSHTAGEPTRLVIGGFPDLGTGTIAERMTIFRAWSWECDGRCGLGGNWFFLIDQDSHRQELDLENVGALTDYAVRVRRAVNVQGFPEIDHVELFGPAKTPGAHARSFVLCPRNAYDRSPCGTGTSAKLACLAAKGALAEGQEWIQESIIGSTFVAKYRREPGHRHEEIFPVITGRAFITAESNLRLDPADPYQWGIRA